MWTDTEMIVWGGEPYVTDVGLYCASGCFVVHRDQDADGHGDAAVSALACEGVLPPGYVTDNTDCDNSNPHCTIDCTNADGDGYCVTADCNDADSSVWGVPGEVRALQFSSDKATLTWTAPSSPGCTNPRYDTLRSAAGNFVGGGVCVESDGSGDTTAQDPTNPAVGQAFYCLVRAESGGGSGSLGTSSAGQERAGRSCP